MKIGKVVKAARKLAKAYRVADGDGFRLKDFDPGDTARLDKEDKPRAKETLQTASRRSPNCRTCSTRRTAGRCCSIFQAMDAAGKDGAIKHVMSGVNPQGCQVTSFKAPSAEELDHDFLWRCNAQPAGARPHRHLQPLLLRGSAGGARAPGVPRAARSCRRACIDKDIWERPLPGHPRATSAT